MLNSSGQGRRLRDASAYVAGVYAQEGPDIGFWRILHELGQLTDERLAELIEEDGRTRISRNLPVTINRYAEAVPDLFDRCDAIDAAIDVTLRSMCGSARFDSASVSGLIRDYPQLETLIREAAALNNAMRSSNDVREVYPVKRRKVPQDFGPRIDTGDHRYELQRVLGLGASGQVYLAVDRRLSERDRPALVAIKVLNPSHAKLSYRERLIEEAKKARRVDHPNVVRVLDLGVTDEGEDYITYEYVTGGDLFQWIESQGGKADPRKAADLMAKVARGVQAAHSAGLVHCDLNPGNIMLTEDGEPKIADFGVAIRAKETGHEELATDGSEKPIGNMLFISPEQFRCEPGSLTVPSDVYSLGSLLFMLLTGELPNGEHANEAAQIHDKTSGRTDAPSVRHHRPKIDHDLDAICRRALAPSREERYSSAGALADDLCMWLRTEPIPWTRPSALRIARLWVRRKPAVASIATVLILCVILLGGWVLQAERQRQEEAIRAMEAERARQVEELRAINAERAQEAERHRAEIERLRADEESRRNEAATVALGEITNLFRILSQDRTSTLFLPAIWSVEYLLKKDILQSSQEFDSLAAVRFDTVERLVELADESNRGSDLEAMLYRSTIAFWLVAAGDRTSLDRAENILDQIEPFWKRALRPDDSWLGHMESIRTAAEVKRVLLDTDKDERDERVLSRLMSRRIALERHEELLGEADPASPLHMLLLDTLILLYDATGDTKAYARAVARRQDLKARL